MATVYAIDEIKEDAHELTRIAIEDNISKTQVINMFHPFNTIRFYSKLLPVGSSDRLDIV